MNPNDKKIIEYLSEIYAGAAATRALWLWAGGVESELEYGKSTIDGWTRMWAKAKDGKGATPVAVIREALFDYPGDEKLLELMDGLADEIFENGRTAAAVLAALLETLEPDFDQKRLWAALQSFPEKSLDESLAAIFSSIQGKFPHTDEPPSEDGTPDTATSSGSDTETTTPEKEDTEPEESSSEELESETPKTEERADMSGVRGNLEKALEIILSEKPVPPPGALAEGMKMLLEQIPKNDLNSNTPDFQSLAEEMEAVLVPAASKSKAIPSNNEETSEKPLPASELSEKIDQETDLAGTDEKLAKENGSGESEPMQTEDAQSPENSTATDNVSLSESETSQPEEFATLMKKMPPFLEELRKMASSSGDPFYLSVVNGLEKQFLCFKDMVEGIPPHSLEAVSKACIQALWGTKG